MSNMFKFTLVSVLTLGLFSIPSFAQEAEAEDADFEEIIITGSRIKRTSNENAPTPMVTLGAEQIELTGSINVYDIINELPQAGEGTSRGNSNFTVNSSGLQTVNLRGLGAGRTLTLVNGRRWVGGVPGTGTVDVNSIPTDLIARIEVITGGASSVYGSDAVAGVVNYILKDDFEGISVQSMSGEYDKGDGETSAISLTFGGNYADGRGNAVFNMRIDEQGSVFARDRAPYTGVDSLDYGYYYGKETAELYFGSEVVTPSYSSYIPQGRFFVSGTQANSAGMLTFDCSQRNAYSNTQSSTVVSYSAAGGGTACGFNRTYFRMLEIPLDRYQAFAKTTFDITENHEFFAELAFSSVDSQSKFEAVPFNSSDIYGGDGTKGISINNPFMPAAIKAAAVANGATEVPFIRRLLEFGERGSANTRDTTRFAFGMAGQILDYDYDIYYQYGVNERVQTSDDYNALNFALALDATTDALGNVVCASEVAIGQGCKPINVFGLNSMSAESLDYVKYESMTLSKNTQEVLAGNISGDFELLGKNIQFATGFEHRRETGVSNPDDLQELGLHGGNVVPYTSGVYSVDGLYVEFLVPLVSDVPFIQDLTFETAYRQDDYTTAGKVSASKMGLNWVINDDWRVRSVLADSVRAPNIDDLFAGQAQTFTSITDPCRNLGTAQQSSNATIVANCYKVADVAATAASGSYNPDTGKTDPGFIYSQPDIQTISGFVGGNPDLREESAETTTIGVVWTPSFVDGLAVSLDYYEIEIEDVISSVSATRLINECFQSANFPNVSQCNAHERFAGTGKLKYWYSYGINQSFYNTAGYDLAANYTFDNLGPIPGLLNIKGLFTRRDNHEFQTTAASTPAQSVGNVGYNEDKMKLTLLWKHNDWIVSLDNTYLGEACDDINYCQPDNEYFYTNNPVDAVNYLDMQVRWTGIENFSFYLGMDNVTGEQPSFCPGCANEPSPGSHYTGSQYRVWDSEYTYFGFNYKWTPSK